MDPQVKHNKDAFLRMSIEQKRTFYRCDDRFKTINDILDWSAYAETDEAKAKLAACSISKGSRRIVKTAVSKESPKIVKKATIDEDAADLVGIEDSFHEDVKEGEADPMTTSEGVEVDPETSGEVKAHPVTGDEVKAEPVTGDEVKAEPMTSDEVKADPVTTDKVQEDAVIADESHENKISMETIKTEEGKAETVPVIDNVSPENDGGRADTSEQMEVDADSPTEAVREKSDADADKTVPSVGEKVFPRSEILNGKISLFTGDITGLEIDAIVNAANDELICGGGVDNAIHTAAGRAMLMKECRQLDGCDTGSAKITGGYMLPAKYVIHAVGPRGEYPDLLRSCYKTAMDLLKKHKLETIAFPCISTGIYGYPNENAANVALETIRKWLDEDEYSPNVKRVIFCLFLERDIKIYHKLLPKYFPL